MGPLTLVKRATLWTRSKLERVSPTRKLRKTRLSSIESQPKKVVVVVVVVFDVIIVGHRGLTNQVNDK